MFTASRILSNRFTECTEQMDGLQTSSGIQITPYSQDIEAFLNEIDNWARSSNSTVDRIITNVFAQSRPALNRYVFSKQEAPCNNIYNLILQAALLRMNDISYLGEAMGMSDKDATLLLEQGDYDILLTKTPNSKNILDPLLQACLCKVIDRIILNDINAGGNGQICRIVNDIQSNYSNGYIPPDEVGTDQMYYDTLPDYDGSGPINDAVIEDIGGPMYQAQPYIPFIPSEEPVNDIQDATDGGFFDWLNKAATSIGNVTGEIGKAGGAISSAINDVKDSVANAGADIGERTVKESIMRNLPLIIGIVVGLTLIVLFIVYAAKSKSK